MAYCNVDDMTDLMSQEGIDLQSTDTGEEAFSDPTIIANAITRATDRVKQFVQKKYDTALLSRSNTWIRFCTATIACVNLMRRKGNSVPPGLQAQYDEYLEELREIKSGDNELPDVSPRHEPGMAMSNLVMDSRFYNGKIRVKETISSGEQVSKKPRNTDIQDFSPNF